MHVIRMFHKTDVFTYCHLILLYWDSNKEHLCSFYRKGARGCHLSCQRHINLYLILCKNYIQGFLAVVPRTCLKYRYKDITGKIRDKVSENVIRVTIVHDLNYLLLYHSNCKLCIFIYTIGFQILYYAV
jgi:hypothetical protein